MASGSGSASISQSVGVTTLSAAPAPSIEGGSVPTEGVPSIGNSTQGQGRNANVAAVKERMH